MGRTQVTPSTPRKSRDIPRRKARNIPFVFWYTWINGSVCFCPWRDGGRAPCGHFWWTFSSGSRAPWSADAFSADRYGTFGTPPASIISKRPNAAAVVVNALYRADTRLLYSRNLRPVNSNFEIFFSFFILVTGLPAGHHIWCFIRALRPGFRPSRGGIRADVF